MTELFQQIVSDHAYHRPWVPIHVLDAGCGAGDGLRLSAVKCVITGIDEDSPGLHANVEARQDLTDSHIGDLRTIPMPPRAYDVVHVSYLLERIVHAELILDRLVAALRPGGLLLMRFRDRASAFGTIDRLMPCWTRGVVWPDDVYPGGPPPAIYDPVASLEGMEDYCLVRGLLLTQVHTSQDTLASFGRWASFMGGLCRAVAAMSFDRLPNGHTDVSLVIQKPENRLARII